MKVILKTYKYRMYPNKEQEQMLAKYFGSVRFVYNHFLAERKQQYTENGKSDNYYAQASTLTKLKKQEEYLWLKEINSQTLQFALRNLETAYTNFFRGNARFPRFKAKKNGGSFHIPQHCSVENGRIYIPKFKGGIKIVEHRPFKGGDVRNMTISVTPSGKYYVSIVTQVTYEPLQKTNAKVGIDLGLKDLVITSDGKRYSSNKFIKHYSKVLTKAQKHLSRKQKGSNSWNRQRIKVARIQEKIHNCRFDKLHKISTDLIRKYDIICCEDLNVKGMQRNHKLAQSISDASWGAFLSMLTYKAVMNDKQVVKIGRYYPSSKTCHHCGWVKEDLSLKDREWTCPNCGEVLDRDLNAAMNILSEGLRNISAGTVDYTDGADVRPLQGQSAKKSEAHKSLVCGWFTKYKLLTLLFCIASLFLTSCGAMAQVVVATTIDTQLGTFTTYYDVYNDYPVIYHQGVPYCRYYFNDAWRYTVIPLEHRHMILHLDRPREFRHMPPPPHYRGYYGPSSTRHFHRPLPPQRHHRPHKERIFHKR